MSGRETILSAGVMLSREGELMEKHYYDAASLERVLLAFERRYELPSDEFFARHREDRSLEFVPGFHRHLWASIYRDFRRLSGGHSFAENAERLLAQPA